MIVLYSMTEKKYLKQIGNSNEYEYTENFDQARNFKTDSCARNSIMAKSIHPKYFIGKNLILLNEPATEENTVGKCILPPTISFKAPVAKAPVMKASVDKDTIKRYDCNVKNKKVATKGMSQKLKTMRTYTKNIFANEDNLNKKLSELDMSINDIQHYIEFNNLNAAQGYKVYKLLQEKMLERREVKNQIHAIQYIRNSGLSSELLGNIITAIDSIDKQSYLPRNMPELFEDGV